MLFILCLLDVNVKLIFLFLVWLILFICVKFWTQTTQCEFEDEFFYDILFLLMSDKMKLIINRKLVLRVLYFGIMDYFTLRIFNYIYLLDYWQLSYQFELIRKFYIWIIFKRFKKAMSDLISAILKSIIIYYHHIFGPRSIILGSSV